MAEIECCSAHKRYSCICAANPPVLESKEDIAGQNGREKILVFAQSGLRFIETCVHESL